MSLVFRERIYIERGFIQKRKIGIFISLIALGLHESTCVLSYKQDGIKDSLEGRNLGITYEMEISFLKCMHESLCLQEDLVSERLLILLVKRMNSCTCLKSYT